MQLHELFALLGAVGLIALYLKIKAQNREISEARQQIFESNNKRAQEISEQIEKLEKEVSEKREKYEDNVRKFRALNNTSDDGSGESK